MDRSGDGASRSAALTRHRRSAGSRAHPVGIRRLRNLYFLMHDGAGLPAPYLWAVGVVVVSIAFGGRTASIIAIADAAVLVPLTTRVLFARVRVIENDLDLPTLTGRLRLACIADERIRPEFCGIGASPCLLSVSDLPLWRQCMCVLRADEWDALLAAAGRGITFSGDRLTHGDLIRILRRRPKP